MPHPDPLEMTPPQPTQVRYRSGAIAFHWVMFVLIILVGVLGMLHDSWPKRSQTFWINLHAIIGLILWLVVLARFTYRLRHAPPPLPDETGSLARRLSSPAHFSLYALMFVIPLVGVVTFVYHGRVFDFGLFQFDPGITKDRAVFSPTEAIHGYLAYALFALATLHASAALWHRFVLHDEVLARMWPL